VKRVLPLLASLAVTLPLASSSLLASGCSGGGAGGGDGGTDGGLDVTCDAMPSAQTAQTVFTSVVQPQCVTCHLPNGQAFSYGDYSTVDKMYAAMVNHPSIYNTNDPSLEMVAPNDLAHSTVWLKIACPQQGMACKSPHGDTIGAPMPYESASLTDADLKVVKDWICTGAKRN